ncbi:MAG: type III-B CRISPR module RAMP protein Cmr6 [Methanotrichaceae archaeon]
MSIRYPLPGDTLQVLQRFQLDQCRNPGLLFSRYAPDWQTNATLKKAGLEVVQAAGLDTNLLDAYRQRWRSMVASQQGEVFEATTEWRLIVGLGQKGPLEVGFTFHRLYGFPIIPGSGLKGLARAYAYLVEGRDESDEDFRGVFGCALNSGEDICQAQVGGAIFFDATPLNPPDLDLDVMNPHYPDYYQKGLPPADWQSPVPIYFLALKPGVRFAFAVGWRRPSDDRRLLSLGVGWLKAGLQELGVGAKTAAGYGYFSEVHR